MTSHDWRTYAVCRGVDPELFFPVGFGKEAEAQTAMVVDTYCLHCPVIADCRTTAEAYSGTEGIWGGRRFEVSHKAQQRLNNVSDANHRLKWSADDLAYLRRRIADPPAALARYLSRSITAVCKKRRELVLAAQQEEEL